MAADLFESYEVTLVASIILGVAAFNSIGANPALGLVFPVVIRAIGVLASIVGVFQVRATDRDKSAMAPINRVSSPQASSPSSAPWPSPSSMWATRTGTRAGRCSGP